MHRFPLLCLVFLWLAGTAEAAPAIKGKLAYEPHSLVRLAADGVSEKAGILWRVYPETVDRADTPRGLLQFAAGPGTYQVDLLCILQTDGQIEIQEARVTVEIRRPQPPTPPGPQPPPPGPQPPPPGPQPPPPGPQPPIKPEPLAAIGRIQFGNSGCTATVIYPRRPDGRWNIATAGHCVSNIGQVGTMRLRSGRSFSVLVAAMDKGGDCAWLVTSAPEADLPYAVLASANPPIGTRVWHSGYGYDKPENIEHGEVTSHPRDNSRGLLGMSLSVSSGDSGGGVAYTANGEIVGVVCCTGAMARKGPMYCGSSVRLYAMLGNVSDEILVRPIYDESPWNWKGTDVPGCGMP